MCLNRKGAELDEKNMENSAGCAIYILFIHNSIWRNQKNWITIHNWYPYEYPIVPGTQEWIKLEDVVARREVCQIPDDVLNHITTDALLETVINYPFRADMYSFNDFQTGYKAVKSRFNGLQELERRSDCLDALLRYSQVSYSSNDDEAEWEHYIADSLYYAISGEQILQDD